MITLPEATPLASPPLEFPPDLITRALAGHDFRAEAEAAISASRAGAECLVTGSATQALDAVATALGVGPGDEIIVPAFTFASSANAFASRGATIRFCDIRPDTLNIDVDGLGPLLSDRTRAIIAVHYGGLPCDMAALTDAAVTGRAAVIEDAAHAFDAEYDGEAVGRLADFGVLSFHQTKAVSCMEGGALIIGRRSRLGRETFEPILQKGVDRSRFQRGERPFYEWTSHGSHGQMSQVHAAMLTHCLSGAPAARVVRRRYWSDYAAALASWGKRHDFRVPPAEWAAQSACEFFYVLAPDPRAASNLIAHLSASGVQAAGHYRPLHMSPMAREFGARPEDCPVAADVADRIVRLPLHNRMSADLWMRVTDRILQWPL